MSDGAKRVGPGPRSDVDVPTLVVDTAERMFGESSFDAVSLRAVAREAGVAPTAVSYHFRTKQALARAVFHRRARPLADRMGAGLRDLAHGDATPSARTIVDAVLQPFVELMADEPVAGLHWMKLFHALAGSDSELWNEELDESPDLIGDFLLAAEHALPDVTDMDALRRMGIAMYSMLGALAGADLPGLGVPLTADGLDPGFVEQLAVFTSAGLQGG